MKKRPVETKDKFIKEKKQIQNALKQAEDKYRSIVETAHEGVLVVDIEGMVTYVNKRMVEMLGYTEQKVIGVSFLKFLDEKEQAYIQENLEGRKRGIRERLIFKKDGSSLWALEAISPLLNANGEINGQLTMITDITERKKTEEILKKTNKELKSKTDQYLAELEGKNKQLQKEIQERKRTEEELKKAQKREIELKRLSDIGTLAAMVAHELRNPLGVIQMAAYNIRKKSKDMILNSHITNIEKKVSESNQIINNLLSYSRIRVPRIEKINILNLLEECVNLAEKRFFNYKVTVNKNFNLLKEEFIEADPIQVKEIFINILNNAYQSLPEKKGKIEINAARNGNGIININIKDNGCGINKEDLPKVFDTFFTKKSKGTGLGLTICKELVALHGGDIFIESEPGEGTNINVNLPIRGKI